MRVSRFRRAALIGAFSAAVVAATQAQDSGPWTEHLLANVPRELSPNTLAWDSWISFTPDLSAVAYAARFRSGDFWRESVVIRGRRQATARRHFSSSTRLGCRFSTRIDC